jgi:hypothetical protein
MCNATAALSLQGAGAASSTVSSYYAADSQKQQLNAQAYMDDLNAKQAEMSAQTAILAGQREEQRARIATASVVGSQRVAQAASGVDLGEGSAARVRASTELVGEVDANTISANAMRTAFGYRTQAVNATNDALMRRATARSISPLLNAASTALTGAGQVASSWYTLNKVGGFDKPPKGK